MSEQPNKSELVQMAWDEKGARVHQGNSETQIIEFLRDKSDVALSPANAKRDELISFIRSNRNRLSLPCNGDCYQHTDGVVLFCHSRLLEDNNASKETKTN